MANFITDSARKLARLGVMRRVTRDYDLPGDPVKVTPFSPGTVSGPAIAFKAFQAVLAGHRARANEAARRMALAASAHKNDLEMRELEARTTLAQAQAVKALRPTAPGTEGVP